MNTYTYTKKVAAAILAASLILLGGCQQQFTKEGVGTLLGGVVGGVAGSQVGGGKGKTVAIVIGTLAGAWIGGSIGAQLDERDRMLAERAMEEAIDRGRSGRRVAWKNPDSGHSGYIVPKPMKQVERRDRYNRVVKVEQCREYSHTVNIGGKKQQAYGTACRQPDGSWKIQ